MMTKSAKPKKARAYEAEVINGHGSQVRTVLAQSGEAARSNINATLSPHERLGKVTPIGWGEVSAEITENETVGFSFKVKDRVFRIEKGDVGYSLAHQLLPEQVKKVQDEIASQYYDPHQND